MGTGLPLYSGSASLGLYTQQCVWGDFTAEPRCEHNACGRETAAPRIRHISGADGSSAEHR
eukprot:8246206-Pyramimonas_sp.AAC.2